MNRSRLLLIGVVALALGAFAGFSVYRNLKSQAGTGNESGVEVVVAAGDLPVGAKVADKDVKVVRLPATDLPPDYIRHTGSVVGRGVLMPISKGEFFLPSKLAGENAGYGLPSLIPAGMRAVSVRVNEVVSVAGFVQPGTRVDVLWTGTPPGATESQTTTVLENVAVIATGNRLERSSTGEASSAAVITLLVSPDDAQKLALASAQGHIQLALRNLLDTQQADLNAARASTLYKNMAMPAPAPRPKLNHVAAPAPPPPSPYEVEIIRGDKKDDVKFQDQPQ